MSDPQRVITIPRIPFSPDGPEDEVTAKMYRDAARNIRYQASRGNSFSGSNLTETVARACDAIALALETKPEMEYSATAVFSPGYSSKRSTRLLQSFDALRRAIKRRTYGEAGMEIKQRVVGDWRPAYTVESD